MKISTCENDVMNLYDVMWLMTSSLAESFLNGEITFLYFFNVNTITRNKNNLVLDNKVTCKVTSSSGLVKFIYHNYSYLLLFGIGKLQSLKLQNYFNTLPLK